MMAEGGEKVACPEVQGCEEYNEADRRKFLKNFENKPEKTRAGALR